MFSRLSFRQAAHGMGLLLLLAVLVITNCSNVGNPISPATTQLNLSTISSTSFSPLVLDQDTGKGPLTRPIVVTETISPTGGTITLSRTLRRGSWTVTLTFHEGSVTEATEVSVTSRNNRLVFDFDPDGLQFDPEHPVTLTLDLYTEPGPSLERFLRGLDIYYYNESTHEWESQSATIVRDGSHLTATVELYHFSQYALGGW